MKPPSKTLASVCGLAGNDEPPLHRTGVAKDIPKIMS